MILTEPPPNPNPDRFQAFGKMLQQRRLAKGLTLRGFSTVIGYSPVVVSRVEQGYLEWDSVVLAMCVELNVPFSECPNRVKD